MLQMQAILLQFLEKNSSCFSFFRIDSQPLFNLESLFIKTSIIMSKGIPEYRLPVKEYA